MWGLPSVNDFIAITIEDTASNPLTNRQYALRTLVSEIHTKFMGTSSYRNYRGNGWGCIIPTVSIGMLGPSWGSKLLLYIGKSDIEWHIDNPASGNGSNTIYNITGSHPYGGIFSIGISGTDGANLTIDSSWTDEAANFIDASTETTMFPTTGPVLEDSGFNVDGTTVNDSEDYDPSGLMAQQLTNGTGAGGTLIMFIKNCDIGSDRAIAGVNTYTRIHAFIWNPLSQVAKRYVDQQGAFADTDTDWGIGAAATYTLNGLSVWYDETGSEVYISGSADGGGASDDVFASSLGTLNIGGGEDALPPFIIHEILTSTVFGFGIPASAINQTCYQLAI
jgi:hypothetical protein